MNLVSPLLWCTFFDTLSTYNLIETRTTALQIIASVQTIMDCMRGFLKSAVPWVPWLGALDFEDQLTVGRRRLFHELVPEALTTPPPPESTYIMQAGTSAATVPAAIKKYIITDQRWYLQQISHCQIFDISRVEELPNICSTIALF